MILSHKSCCSGKVRSTSSGYLHDLRVALASKGAQDEPPSLGCAGSVDGLEPGGPHGLVVIVLPREDFAVGIIPTGTESMLFKSGLASHFITVKN